MKKLELAPNAVVHETRWVCWPLLGGCGATHGMNFQGGACPRCGEYAVARIKLVQRPPTRVAPMANLRPLSLSEESELVELTQIVPEGELRVALESLGRAVTASRR